MPTPSRGWGRAEKGEAGQGTSDLIGVLQYIPRGAGGKSGGAALSSLRALLCVRCRDAGIEGVKS